MPPGLVLFVRSGENLVIEAAPDPKPGFVDQVIENGSYRSDMALALRSNKGAQQPDGLDAPLGRNLVANAFIDKE